MSVILDIIIYVLRRRKNDRRKIFGYRNELRCM